MAPVNTPHKSLQSMSIGQYRTLDIIAGKKIPAGGGATSGYAQWLIDGELERRLGVLFQKAHADWRSTLGLQYEQTLAIGATIEESSAEALLRAHNRVRGLEGFFDSVSYESEGHTTLSGQDNYRQEYFHDSFPPRELTTAYGYVATDMLEQGLLLACLGPLSTLYDQAFSIEEIVWLIKHGDFKFGTYFFFAKGRKVRETIMVRYHYYLETAGVSPRISKTLDFYNLRKGKRDNPTEALATIYNGQHLILRKRFDQ
jgi:hypothetical protein